MNHISPNDTSVDEMSKVIAALKAENAKLKAVKVKGLSLKVSSKGGLSVYGMGRWPVTLYKSQWTKLLDATEQIQQFLKDNDGELKDKDAPKTKAALKSEAA